MSEWQPIETAPKDEWILTWDEGGGHALLKHNPIFAMAGEEADGWMGATHWMPLAMLSKTYPLVGGKIGELLHRFLPQEA